MTSLTILRTGLSQLKQSLEEARLEATSVQDYEQAVDQDLEDAISLFPHSAPFSGSLQIESGTRRANFVELDLSSLWQPWPMTYSAVAEDLGKTLSRQSTWVTRSRGPGSPDTALRQSYRERAATYTGGGDSWYVPQEERA
jgi:hypothetical protein